MQQTIQKNLAAQVAALVLKNAELSAIAETLSQQKVGAYAALREHLDGEKLKELGAKNQDFQGWMRDQPPTSAK